MLTNAIRILVYKLFLETFYWENEKKNVVDSFIIIIIIIIISHETSVKAFLSWFINNCPQGIR